MIKTIVTGRISHMKFRSKDDKHVLVFQVMSTTNKKQSDGTYKDIVTPIFLTMFGARAKACHESGYFKVGHLVDAVCETTSNVYEKDGQKVYSYDHKIESMNLLSRTLDEMIANREKYREQGHAGNVPDTNFETSESGDDVVDITPPVSKPKAPAKNKGKKADSDGDRPF